MAKNFDEIGCLFCGSAMRTGDSFCTRCNKPLSIESHFIGQGLEDLTLAEYRARGFYGLTFRAQDKNKKDFALKLISKNSYQSHGKDFLHEAEAYAKLPNHPCIAAYVRTGEAALSFEDDLIAFYFILSEWVPGITFKEWLGTAQITPRKIYLVARDLLTAVQAFEEVNLWHNDLHEDNVLVADLSRSQQRALQRQDNKIFKIVDIGSARFRSEVDLKEINDLNYIGRHLSEGHSCLATRIHTFAKEDQQFLRVLPTYCARLIDEDPSRGFDSAEKGLDEIERMWKTSRSLHLETSETLEDPYGLINALDIRSPKLIREMFSEKFRYFSRIDSMDNHAIIVTGPRGCGKTMILKRMSFGTSFNPEQGSAETAISRIKYIGVFLSARVEFGNLLVAVRRPKWITNTDFVGLYFNGLITLALIDIMYCLIEHKLESASSIQPVIDLMVERLKIPPCDIFSSRSYIIQICQSIVLDKDNISEWPNALNATPRYLDDLVNAITGTIPSLRGKEVVILIDDLSWPRIPDCIMEILAPFLFNTGANYKIRVSAHSEGIITRDQAGEEYKDNRDFIEINLGREYYQLSENYEGCRKGFDDLMDRRFRLAGRGPFPGLEIVLGRGDELKDLGTVIKKLFEKKKLRTLKYWGARVFVKLCSGDLSYLVEILGFMAERGKDRELPISRDVQSDVIRNYARTQLRLLRDVKTEVVSSLYDVGLSFGAMSKAKLFKEQKEHLRIEVEAKDITQELWNAIRELLSAGVFIDGGYSNTSSGIPARRLLFRRIYTPAFPTTVNNRNSFSMTEDAFMNFVRRPRLYTQTALSRNGFSSDEVQKFEQLDIPYE